MMVRIPVQSWRYLVPLSLVHLSILLFHPHNYCDTIDQAALADLQAAQGYAQDLDEFGLRPNLSVEEEWEQLQQAGIKTLMSAFRHFIIDDAQDALCIPGQ